jgi:Na+/melibiose symporter-like transporter
MGQFCHLSLGFMRGMIAAQDKPSLTMRPIRPIDFVTMNLYYFGISFLWNSLGRFLLQALLPQSNMAGPAHAIAAFGLLAFCGLLIATIVQPLAGAFSDRFASRWGRRRPFVIVASLTDLVFLAAIVFAPNYWFLLVAYCLLQLSSNVAHGPYQGLLPDLVPPEQRGVASSIKQFIDTFGSIGLVLTRTMLLNIVLVHEPILLSESGFPRTNLLPRQVPEGL